MTRFLQVVEGICVGRTFELDANLIVIGRASTCQIVLSDRKVSRRHAALTLDQGSHVITDLSGTNPTYVNGEVLRAPRILREGDQIEVCGNVFLYSVRPRVVGMDSDQCSSAILNSIAVGSTHIDAPHRLEVALRIACTLGRTLNLDTLFSTIFEGVFAVFPAADRGLVLFRERDRFVCRAIRYRLGSVTGAEYSNAIVERAFGAGQALLSEDIIRERRSLPAESTVPQTFSRSVMCVPIMSHDGNPLGVIQLDTQGSEKRFHVEDLELLVAIASQVSLAVEYARLHAREMELARVEFEVDLAREVQQGFLPKTVPLLDGYGFWAYTRPARKVGGDFYDFVQLRDGRLAVLLADVAGKGVPAALVMSKAATLCRFILTNGQCSTGQLLKQLNYELLEVGAGGTFVTLCLCALDPYAHSVELVNAGHLHPLLLQQNRTVRQLIPDDCQGPPLGIVEDIDYNSDVVRLASGDSVVLFSDGVTDATNSVGISYGKRVYDQANRLCGGTPAEIGKAMLDDLRTHVGDCDQADDLTLVVFGRDRAC